MSSATTAHNCSVIRILRAPGAARRGAWWILRLGRSRTWSRVLWFIDSRFGSKGSALAVRDWRAAQILERIDRIVEYTTGGREAFLGDLRTQDAVIRNF